MSTRMYNFRHRISYHRLLRLVWHVYTRRKKAGGKDLQEANERKSLKYGISCTEISISFY